VSEYAILRDGRPLHRIDAPAIGYVDRAYDGMTHTYQVRAVGPGGDALSGPASIPAAPAAPQKLAAAVTDEKTVAVTWDQPSGGPVIEYSVRRDGREIARPGPAARSYVDRGYDGAAHTYDVWAIGPGGAARSGPATVPPSPGPSPRMAAACAFA
jgi:hypothetical protein